MVVKNSQMRTALFGSYDENTINNMRSSLETYGLDYNNLGNHETFNIFDNIVSDRAVKEAKETLKKTSSMRFDGIYELRVDELNRANGTIQEYLMENPLIKENIDVLDGFSTTYVDKYEDSNLDLEFKPEFYQAGESYDLDNDGTIDFIMKCKKREFGQPYLQGFITVLMKRRGKPFLSQLQLLNNSPTQFYGNDFNKLSFY